MDYENKTTTWYDRIKGFSDTKRRPESLNGFRTPQINLVVPSNVPGDLCAGNTFYVTSPETGGGNISISQ
jgi:hypothetical protein